MQLDISTETLKSLAEKLVSRLNQLGLVTKTGQPVVIDLGYEAVAAMLGCRNQHVLRATLKSRGHDVAPDTYRYQENMAQWGADSKAADDLVYGYLRANGESLSEFTSESISGSIVGMLSRARLGLDVVEPKGLLNRIQPSPVAEAAKQRLIRQGYAVKYSGANRHYWQVGNDTSIGFETAEAAWRDAWGIAIGRGILDVPEAPPEAESPTAMQSAIADLEQRWSYEHPRHTRSWWRDEVRDDNTRLGYWEWVVHQIEADGGDADTSGSYDREPSDIGEEAYELFDFGEALGENFSPAARSGWEYTTGVPEVSCTVFLEDSTTPDAPTRAVRFTVDIVNGLADNPRVRD